MAVRSALVGEQVFAAMVEAILSGQYAPGEALPPQRTLAADLGVTMTSLREALKRLEQMGLVDVRHGDASRVRDWRAHGGLDVLAHALLRGGSVDARLLGDVFEARTLMLREIAGLAAERRSDAQAAELERLAAALRAAPDARAAAAIDFALVTELAQAAGNLVFVLIINAIRDLYLAHADRLPITAGHEELAPRYARLAAAVAARDAGAARDEAAALARAHAERVGL
jgi:GntR family transcriptional repressor for pyruvate dehydrogenase complex